MLQRLFIWAEIPVVNLKRPKRFTSKFFGLRCS